MAGQEDLPFASPLRLVRQAAAAFSRGGWWGDSQVVPARRPPPPAGTRTEAGERSELLVLITLENKETAKPMAARFLRAKESPAMLAGVPGGGTQLNLNGEMSCAMTS